MENTTSRACEVCGNEYEKMFQVKIGDDDRGHWFDCFECAVQAMAPICLHCGVRIVGHGVQEDESIYCCAHCARAYGARDLVDNSNTAGSVFLSGVY